MSLFHQLCCLYACLISQSKGVQTLAGEVEWFARCHKGESMGPWEKSLPVKAPPPTHHHPGGKCSPPKIHSGSIRGAGRKSRRGVTPPRPVLSRMDPGSALSFPLTPGPGFRLPFGESMEGWAIRPGNSVFRGCPCSQTQDRGVRGRN